jgi:hypothetical protein
MKITFSLLLAAAAAFVLAVLTTGCVRFSASQVFYDPEAKTVVTNQASGTFVFAKSAVEKLEVAKRTKTTSALIGAKNAETANDTEALGTLIGAAMKAAK